MSLIRKLGPARAVLYAVVAGIGATPAAVDAGGQPFVGKAHRSLGRVAAPVGPRLGDEAGMRAPAVT